MMGLHLFYCGQDSAPNFLAVIRIDYKHWLRALVWNCFAQAKPCIRSRFLPEKPIVMDSSNMLSSKI